MKKFLLTLMGVICTLGVWAENVTFGITRTIESGKLSDDINVGTNVKNVTFTAVYGSQDALTDKDRTIYHGSSTGITVPKGIKNYRNKINSSTDVLAFNEDCFYSFKLTIAQGKALTIKSINGDICTDGDGFVYRMVVKNNDQTVYTCSDKTISKSSNTGDKSVDCTTGEDKFANLIKMTGTVQVYMYWWNSASKTGKYCDIKDFNIVAEVVDAGAQTQYSKPSISLGAYDQPTGKYAVKLSTQNSEEGTINYTVGSEAKVTGAASGTTINVAPNTTITATVTGSAYSESDEASLTVAAAPQLAIPTVEASVYDFAKGKYEVTLTSEAGTISYTTDNWATSSTYNDPVLVAANTTLKAKAEQENMTTSAELVYVAPVTPQDGKATTPTTAGTYSSNENYDLGPITIPGACIAGQISSGSTPINGSIKTRCNQTLTASTGFYFTVNPSYAITAVKIEGCSNQTGSNDCLAVYVDGVKQDDFTSATLPLAEKNGSKGTIALDDIFATKKIEFVFSQTYQAQMNITVEYVVSEYKSVNPSVGYGTMYYANKNLIIPEGVKAYVGYLEGSKLTLDEITEDEDSGARIIKAGTAVVYTGSGVFTPTSEVGEDYEDNDLKGASTATPTSSITSGTVAVLGYENGKTGFYKYTGATLGANKAYLIVPESNAAKSITIAFKDDPTAVVGVTETQTQTAAQKIFSNGMLLIKTAQGTVNAAGAQVNE